MAGERGGGIPGRDRGAVPHEIHNDPVSGVVIELKGEARHLWKAVGDLKEASRHQGDDLIARVRGNADDFNGRLAARDQEQSLFRGEMYGRLGKIEHWKAGVVACLSLMAVLLLLVWRFAGSAARGEVQEVVKAQSEADRKFFDGMKAELQVKMIRLEEMEKLRKEATESAAQREKGRR